MQHYRCQSAAGATRWKAFNYGQASAIVEPIFATIGAAAILVVNPILPYALAFAAGAMIFVVVEERYLILNQVTTLIWQL